MSWEDNAGNLEKLIRKFVDLARRKKYERNDSRLKITKPEQVLSFVPKLKVQHENLSPKSTQSLWFLKSNKSDRYKCVQEMSSEELVPEY